MAAAGAVLLLSFLALGALWRTSRLRGDEAGVPLPRGLQAVLDAPVTTVVLRAAVLLATLFVVVVALAGPVESTQNLSVYALYVTFWVGLVPASLLLGPVWSRVNPLRTVHAALRPLTGPPPGAEGLDRVGYWPAAAGLLVFTWLELVFPDRAVPTTVGVFLVVYAVVQLVAALWYGEQWFARGDAFEVYSTLLGRLSPFGRRTDGRLVVRSPLDGADGTPARAGLVAVVVVLVGSTAFDGVTRTLRWQTGPGLEPDDVVTYTAGLLATIALVALVYVGAAALAGRLAGLPDGPALFAHSVVPIAAGYAVAHYFSLLVIENQTTLILASNPFAQDGVDLFGTYGNALDLAVVSASTIQVVQIGAIVLGHVVGVVLAHDRAVRAAPTAARAQTSQYPLLAVMVGLTVGGLGLLLG